MENSFLVEIENVSDAVIADVNPGETRIIFFDAEWAYIHVSEAANALSQGTLIAYDISRGLVPPMIATGILLNLASEAANLHASMENAPNLAILSSIQASWNISVYQFLISVVRGEMINIGLKQLGLTPFSILNKLGPIVQLLAVGMFVEASQAISAIPTDAFLTPDRISRYASLMLSANAITEP
jgi:hypothetical protein